MGGKVGEVLNRSVRIHGIDVGEPVDVALELDERHRKRTIELRLVRIELDQVVVSDGSVPAAPEALASS